MAYLVKIKSDIRNDTIYCETLDEAIAEFDRVLFWMNQGWIAHDTDLNIHNLPDSPHLCEFAHYYATTGIVERMAIKKKRVGRR